MCFSARASLTAAALLLPLGALAVSQAMRGDAAARLPLALTPLLFGLQQAAEGLVWLGLAPQAPALASRLLPQTSVAYLFFAYGLWPGWISFIALRWGAAGQGRYERRWLQAALTLGVFYGLVLWLPQLLDPSGSIPRVLQGSLHYPVVGPLVDHLGRLVGQGLYAALIALPLLLPRTKLRSFGISLLLAFCLTQLAYDHAFVSVWCFFSALLSLQIIWIVSRGGCPEHDRPSQA